MIDHGDIQDSDSNFYLIPPRGYSHFITMQVPEKTTLNEFRRCLWFWKKIKFLLSPDTQHWCLLIIIKTLVAYCTGIWYWFWLDFFFLLKQSFLFQFLLNCFIFFFIRFLRDKLPNFFYRYITDLDFWYSLYGQVTMSFF